MTTSGQPQGVLTDDDIIAEAANGNLISDGFAEKNVRQACYELRAGDTYYDLSDDERRIVLAPADHVLLKPYQMVVIITKEQLDLPFDILGRILMKGQLFSLGVQPVSTYADPGFSGHLGIVMFNSSPNYLKIERDSAIAKIEFERLSKPVGRPYSGQHGYQTGIWPIPKHLILDAQEVRSHPRIQSPPEELRRAFGGDFGSVVHRVFRFEKILLMSTLTYIFLAVILIAISQATETQFSVVFALVLGVITNLASQVVTFLATHLVRRHGKA